MVWTSYKEKLSRLSQRLVDLQRPIRILDSVKWQPWVEEELRKSKFREVPKVDASHFEAVPLGFDPAEKLAALRELDADIERELGDDELGNLLRKVVDEYLQVIEMLGARGTRRFWEVSRRLYGSPKDTFFDAKSTISELGHLMYQILSGIHESEIGQTFPRNLTAKEVVSELNHRFESYFVDDPVRAKISDGIVADASAGSDVVKVREGSLFSSRDVDVLEVHEGWVHVGTTQNGSQQHVARWLSKGPPRCSSTQEGLAVIMEIFTFRSYPRRAKRINDRIIGVEKAEEGANIVELIEFYRTEGYSEDESLANAKRVFRGGVLEGGAPFTKDISYCKGFIENYNFMRAAVRAGHPQLLPFLFVGKIHVDDVPLLYQKFKEGIVDPPRYLPPQFRDVSGLAVWMSFSSFLNQIDLRRIQSHYDKLFQVHRI